LRRAFIQTNGDLAILQDRNNRYWLVNRKTGAVYPDTFSLKEEAAREAASVSFLYDPSAPSPTWKERTR
jgi:hypothetical protein